MKGQKSDFCHNYSQAVMNVELFLRFSKEIAWSQIVLLNLFFFVCALATCTCTLCTKSMIVMLRII